MNMNDAPFDHGAWWVAQLGAPPAEAVQDVFKFVREQHPLFGCATARDVPAADLLHRPLEEAAKHVDAVTFRCVELVGHSQDAVRARARAEFERLGRE
jgi:hypothetical protein